MGQTITGSSFSKNFGGKGANQAVMAARLGVATTMCGMVGQDAFGDGYIEQLRREGCDTEHFLQCATESTGIAHITVDGAGQNTIVIVPGANLTLSEAHVESIRPVLQSSCVAICQNEISLSSTIAALKLARECQVVTIFNPAPANMACTEALPHADIVCPNETELSLLTSLPTETDAQVVTAAAALMELSGGACKTVIVSLGARGACVVTPTTASFVPAPVVKAVDTVGAGDCFLGRILKSLVLTSVYVVTFLLIISSVGSFAGYLARGIPLLQAVGNAVQCASVSVTRRGAQSSYPIVDELGANLHPPARNYLVK